MSCDGNQLCDNWETEMQSGNRKLVELSYIYFLTLLFLRLRMNLYIYFNNLVVELLSY